MNSKELILIVREYNKTLKPKKFNDFERALYNNIQERDWFNFSNISGPQFVEDDPDEFLKKNHHFQYLLNNTNVDLLDAYIQEVCNYSYSKDYLRIGARSKDLSKHYSYLLKKIASFYVYTGANLSIKDMIYGQYRSVSISFAPVIASYLLLENEEVIGYCKDVLLSENNTAVITRDVIEAIEMSHNEELQDLLIALFKAAKLQEGLRQAVAETCDEYQYSFFKKALQVIIDENFVRYSSIQRAILTWLGLGSDNFEPKDCIHYLGILKKYVLDNQPIEIAIQSDDPLESYVALYAIGAIDSKKAIKKAYTLLEDIERYKVASLIFYLYNSKSFISEEHLEFFDKYKDDLCIMSMFFSRLSNEPKIEKDTVEEYYKKIELYLRTFKDQKKIHTKGFDWLTFQLERSRIASFLYTLLKLNPTQELITLHLPYSKYMWGKQYDDFVETYVKRLPIETQKQFFINGLSDTSFQKRCQQELLKLDLDDQDLIKIEDKLKSKRTDTRKLVSEILTSQKEDVVLRIHERLKSDKNVFKQDAVKEIERKFSSVFHKEADFKFYGLEEGFNIFTPVEIKEKDHTSYLKVEKKGLLLKKEEIALQYNFKYTKEEIIVELMKLSDYFDEHHLDTYISPYGHEECVLENFRKDFSKKGLDQLPLKELWVDYFKKNPMNSDMVSQIHLLFSDRGRDGIISELFVHPKVFDMEDFKMPYLNQVLMIIYSLEENNTFEANLELLSLFSKTCTRKTTKSYYREVSICEKTIISRLLSSIENNWNDDTFKQAFDVLYDVYYKYKESNGYCMSPIFLTEAYRRNVITRDELFTLLFDKEDNLKKAFSAAYFENRYIGYYNRKAKLDLYELGPYSKETVQMLRDILQEIADTFLHMECHRLNEDTPVTKYLKNIYVILGVKYIPLILEAVGNDRFERNSFGNDKNSVLTNLIRYTYPTKEDDLSILKGIDKKILIDICMIANHWIEPISSILNWDGFTSGCFYFIAHMKDYNLDSKKAQIARFTDLEPEELRDGAFDQKWFHEIYNQLGDKRFKALYESSKYLCDSAAHTRARKYADAALNKLDQEKTLDEVKKKRNKDLLNAYCIFPVQDKKDLQERYLYVQQFIKESKQFGSQRQASEKRSAEIALINLAKNTEYENATRLTWAMETQIVKEQLSYTKPTDILGYRVCICIDEFGMNTIVIENEKGKTQKSIPAKIKKLPEFEEIQKVHKQWSEQYRRSKKLLEQAMEERVEFKKEELKNLLENPIISSMVQSLLFVDSHHIDYVNADTIDSFDEIVRIAHCYDLYKSGRWKEYQQDLYDKQIKQPFKQVFRELYTKLDEELEKSQTQRYSGYQISVKKAISALKSRRWNISYDEGIERVYYQDNLVVNLYADADWFSPSDIESPSIDYVCFYPRKGNEKIKIKDIHPITYSEIMRDIDLACSISYVGGVDPITSTSTIELRKSIVECTSRLMKLKNVSIKDNFAYIQGTLGNYLVHLQTGMIHQEGKGSLHILPVHSAHRGKLYLPFIDEDPKCQEVLSKIILLSEDKKIKDPSILQQIQ